MITLMLSVSSAPGVNGPDWLPVEVEGPRLDSLRRGELLFPAGRERGREDQLSVYVLKYSV